MSVSRRRVGAIVRKELRDYKRRGSIVYAMTVIPVLFIVPAMIHLLGQPVSAFAGLGDYLLYMLGMPAVLAAYSVGAFASFPSIVVAVLIAIGVIPASLLLALILGAVLLVLDGLGWRVTSAMFDRERLITGTR